MTKELLDGSLAVQIREGLTQELRGDCVEGDVGLKNIAQPGIQDAVRRASKRTSSSCQNRAPLKDPCQ